MVTAQWEDTIVALATPPGIGALGIIRLSGNAALLIVNALFPSKDLSLQVSHTLHVGVLKHAGRVIDEVVISLYKAPRSYTGEDVVEISCHGSPFIHQQVIEACMAKGARLAKPGEFTQRAFLAGKLDLTQAEAVADLIASNTTAAHKTALHNIRGGFSAVLKNLREQLIRFSALIELELDFSQEDVTFADRPALQALILQIKKETDDLRQSFKLGNVIRNGVSVAIIGKPNAGKSTLLNALLNEERAIVSDIPGTTRDTVEEVLNIDGILFRLIDTAGIRQHSNDVIETAGIQRSVQKMKEADLVLYVFDVHETTPEALAASIAELQQQAPRYLLLGNKIDSVSDPAIQERLSAIPDILFIGARVGANLDVLKRKMLETVLHDSNAQTENVIVTNARHYQALTEVTNALQDVLEGLAGGLPGDLLALDVRRCLHYLGEIMGAITNEDQLDYIFSKFCIGK
jgi:tRNA modification GTPase